MRANPYRLSAFLDVRSVQASKREEESPAVKLINERSHIRDVANAWAKQYPEALAVDSKTPDRRRVLVALLNLDTETATAQDVSAIIGNDSWTPTIFDCHECGAEVPAVVELGEPQDHESWTAQVCPACLRKALDLAEGKEITE